MPKTNWVQGLQAMLQQMFDGAERGRQRRTEDQRHQVYEGRAVEDQDMQREMYEALLKQRTDKGGSMMERMGGAANALNLDADGRAAAADALLRNNNDPTAAVQWLREQENTRTPPVAPVEDELLSSSEGKKAHKEAMDEFTKQRKSTSRAMTALQLMMQGGASPMSGGTGQAPADPVDRDAESWREIVRSLEGGGMNLQSLRLNRKRTDSLMPIGGNALR